MKNTVIVDEEVAFTINTKELKGILIFPDSESPHLAIVLLHGSDRAR